MIPISYQMESIFGISGIQPALSSELFALVATEGVTSVEGVAERHPGVCGRAPAQIALE
jgi:hypothetical protein